VAAGGYAAYPVQVVGVADSGDEGIPQKRVINGFPDSDRLAGLSAACSARLSPLLLEESDACGRLIVASLCTPPAR
jgi:hypothetical protein